MMETANPGLLKLLGRRAILASQHWTYGAKTLAMEGLDELIALTSLYHECQLREAQLQETNNNINKLQQEVARLSLEKEWCFDAKHRIIPSAEEQTVKICQQLSYHPELLEDFVKALRMKRIDLLCNLNELEQRCGQMKEEIRKP